MDLKIDEVGSAAFLADDQRTTKNVYQIHGIQT